MAASDERAKMDTDTDYFLRRASEEARRAIASDEPKAAEVHEALSVRYSAKALTLLVAEDADEALASPDPALPAREND